MIATVVVGAAAFLIFGILGLALTTEDGPPPPGTNVKIIVPRRHTCSLWRRPDSSLLTGWTDVDPEVNQSKWANRKRATE